MAVDTSGSRWADRAEAALRELRDVHGVSLQMHGEKVSDLSQSWSGNTLAFGFKTFGIKINGAVDVLEDVLKVTCDIPFAAMMFKGKIESEVRQQLERLVS